MGLSYKFKSKGRTDMTKIVKKIEATMNNGASEKCDIIVVKSLKDTECNKHHIEHISTLMCEIELDGKKYRLPCHHCAKCGTTFIGEISFKLYVE